MAWKYLSKADIVNFVSMQFTIEEDDIPDIVMDRVHAKVDAELVKLKVDPIPTEVDEYGFLRFAALAWALELLARNGMISQTNGDVLRETFGKVTREFQRKTPLFFFATGTSKPFQELLPHESFRMMLYSYLRAYKQWKFVDETGRTKAIPKVVYDKTSRGRGWNWDLEDISNEDKAYGEYYFDDY